MRKFKVILIGMVTVAALAVPTAAFADSCGNVSRAAPSTTTSGPIIKGNWAWLPSIDPNAPPIWGFAPPGAPDSTAFGLPGANGNYSGVHNNQSLLDQSHNCPAGSNTNRQTSHGIQSGCE